MNSTDTKIEAIYPLSPAQSGILFHSEMAGISDPYLGQMVLALKGSLRIDALKQSWRRLSERHSILRTAFVTERQGLPKQVVLNKVEIPFRQMDWRELNSEEKEAEWKSLLEADRGEGLNVARAPLFRLLLVRFEDDLYRLLWTEHHLILDGWSVMLLLNELSALYTAEVQGVPADLPPAHPYRDYIDWFATQDVTAAETYWRTLFHGFSAPAKLNSYFAGPTTEHGLHVARLDPNTLEQLKEKARRQRVTLSVVVQAAWTLLLSRYLDSDQVVYGVTSSGRPAELNGVEDIAGPFICTLPVRFRISPAMQFDELCRQVMEQQLETQRFEYTSLADIQRWVGVGQGQPLLEAIFVFENYPARTCDSSTSHVLPLISISASEQNSFPLALLVGAGTDLSLKILYDAGRFEEIFVKDLLDRFMALLRLIGDHPTSTLAEISVLNDSDRLSLERWSGVAATYPRQQSISQLFEQAVHQNGSSIALESSLGVWTYDELDRRSNQLARYLRSRGIGLEDVVGVHLERGPGMILSILGVLKAGGAYLPLDTNLPAARLHYMLSDCKAQWIIAGAHLDVLSDVEASIIYLDSDAVAIGAASTEPLPGFARPQNAAYVMYTSGSTGKPKGTTIEHRAVVRLVKGTNYFAVSPHDKFLQFAPLAFDASTFEIWGSLLNGACLVLAPPQIPSLDEIGEIIQHYGVTTLWLTAGLFRCMIEAYSESLAGVSQLLAGGEALPVSTVRDALRLLPEIRLINGYGPTENCTFTCCHTITAEDVHRLSIPIGNPVSNSRVYILDGALEPTVPGVAGELYAAGDGLARDYLGRRGLTAERFLPDPFAKEPGSRMYRTGDRARFLSNGDIEFLGRVDGQVKIRGFRIEIDEIEAILLKSPSIRQCAVAVWTSDTETDAGLIAFVVPRSGDLPLDMKAIRRHLEAYLPGYMVPARTLAVDALPLTRNGKIDRLALLASCGSPTVTDAPKPATPLEQILEGIWRDLLRIGKVSRIDDFFELGGNSLLAMQAISRIRNLVGTHVPLSIIFEKTTIAELASEIEKLLSLGRPEIPPITAVPRGRNLPLSLAQQRLWFLDRLEPGNRFYNIHLAFRIKGALDIRVLEQALLTLGMRHESLRTTFPDNDGEPMQIIADAPAHSLRRIRAVEGMVDRIVQSEAHAPFSLSEGPLFRPVLVEISSTDYVLLLVMHHIISDGRSVSVLLDELSRLYAKEALGPVAIQYADYAAWEHEWLKGGEIERLAGYWSRSLENAPTQLKFSETRERPEWRSVNGAVFSRLLPFDLTEQLDGMCRREGATRFMVLLAAYYLLLRRHATQDDLIVGADVANRNSSEVQNTVGFFINQIALRINILPEETFRAFVARVRKMTLGAYAHHNLPFQKVVDMLKIERRANQAALFQAKLLYQQGEGAKPAFAGMEIESFPIPLDASAFDLVLAILDSDAGLLATFEYDTDILDAGMVDRIAEEFELILSMFLGNPSLTIQAMDERLDEVQHRRSQDARLARETAVFKLLHSVKPVPVSQ